MSTTPATPELTINNTASELKAALEAQASQPQDTPPPASAPVAAPPAPPAEPPKAEWGNVAKNADGSYQVTLATGEVFKGTADEVIAKQAEAHVNTKKWGQEWKQKFETVQPPTPPSTPAAPQETPEEVATREWIIAQQAKALGMSPEDYKVAVQRVFQTAQKTEELNFAQQVNASFIDFCQACPDYSDSPEAAAALADYLPPDVISHQRAPKPEDFKAAHAQALYAKRYAPVATPTTGRPSVPPIMPSSGVSAASGEPNPWVMPKDQLKREADAWLRNDQ